MIFMELCTSTSLSQCLHMVSDLPPWFDHAMRQALNLIDGKIDKLTNDVQKLTDDIQTVKNDVSGLKKGQEHIRRISAID